jgi:hypothetical protein
MLCDDDSLKGMRRVQPDLTQRSGILPGAPQSRQSAKLFLQSSELGLPQPLARRLVRPSPDSGGEGERGVGRVPIPTRGHTLWYSLYIRTLRGAISLLVSAVVQFYI